MERKEISLKRIGLLVVVIAAPLAAWGAYALWGRALLAPKTRRRQSAVMAHRGDPGPIQDVPGGWSLAEIVRRGRIMCAEANDGAAGTEALDAVLRAENLDEKPDARRVWVVHMKDYAAAPNPTQRAFAATAMCDHRVAQWERAGEAIPALEAIAANHNEAGSEFAPIAIKRIRFWEAKRRGAVPKP